MLSLPGLGLGVYAAMAPDAWTAVLALWATGWLVLAVHALIRARFGDALIQALPIDSLQPGMVPAAGICAGTDRSHGPPSYVCVEDVGRRRHALCRPGVPLTDKDVAQLRPMAARGLFAGFGARLPVETPVPFAPFLVLSVVLTAVLAGHVGLPLLRLVRQLVS